MGPVARIAPSRMRRFCAASTRLVGVLDLRAEAGYKSMMTHAGPGSDPDGEASDGPGRRPPVAVRVAVALLVVLVVEDLGALIAAFFFPALGLGTDVFGVLARGAVCVAGARALQRGSHSGRALLLLWALTSLAVGSCSRSSSRPVRPWQRSTSAFGQRHWSPSLSSWRCPRPAGGVRSGRSPQQPPTTPHSSDAKSAASCHGLNGLSRPCEPIGTLAADRRRVGGDADTHHHEIRALGRRPVRPQCAALGGLMTATWSRKVPARRLDRPGRRATASCQDGRSGWR